MSSPRRSSLQQQRRNSSQHLDIGGPPKNRRASLSNIDGVFNSSRRSSLSSSMNGRSSSSRRRLSPNDLHELEVHLGRTATTSELAPITQRERRQRRSSRKEDFQRVQSVRNERMGSLKDQWTTHRKSFVSEDDEIAKISNKSGGTLPCCCGWDLCCGW